MAWRSAGLFQRIQSRAEVDVVRLALDHERGNRSDAGRLRLRDAALLLAKMHHFHLEPSTLGCRCEWSTT